MRTDVTVYMPAKTKCVATWMDGATIETSIDALAVLANDEIVLYELHDFGYMGFDYQPILRINATDASGIPISSVVVGERRKDNGTV